jgi:2-polyprenyl-3-methyl-5-hydroxy-6-metoxy-1,4-benzoquinol methylase
MPEELPIIGNYYYKYASKNPIERYLIKRYEDTFKRIVASLPVKSIYEVGSGEGVLIKWLTEIKPEIKIYGSDIEPIFDFSLFRDSLTAPTFLINEADNIPFSANSVDGIIACEVLEHLPNPARSIQELKRMNAQYYLFTVPNDKLWKILNMIRLKYIKDLGNTPGHINHWSRKSFCKLVSEYLNINYSLYVQPWIFVLATAKKASQEKL